MARVEEACGVQLPDRVAAEARTVGDLLQAVRVGSARPLGKAETTQIAMPAGGSFVPDEARTLIEVLDWHAERQPDQTQIWLYGDEEEVTELTFADLRDMAEEVAAGLAERDLQQRQAVAIMLPTGEGFFAAFFGILLAGGVPVPLYPPTRPSQLEEHLRRQAGILRTAETPLMITVPEAQRLGRFLQSQVPTLRELPTVSDLRQAGRLKRRLEIDTDDTAFLQFTSGSTGDPKGVVLSHANLLANVRVICDTVRPTPDDVFVSWLPLYHDMGLIGAVLATMYHAVPLVLMSPLHFLIRPERWLWAIHRHRGSLTAAPNFAYELCVKKIAEEKIEGLDLSSWKMTLNGAEPISPQTMQRFADRFAPHGYRSAVMTPTFGLAEGSLGVTMSPVEREPLVDRVRRSAFARGGRALPAEPGEEVLEFVNCGAPLRGHEVRIVDEKGREIEERREGRIQFRGPSATKGYFQNEAATRALISDDGWLETGDLGYVAAGELYVTGRIKDVILLRGRNLYPHELEELVGELDGVRKGCVAVFGATNKESGTEELVVLAETREVEGEVRAKIEQAIREATTDLLGGPPDDIVLAPPHTVLKTSSGKVRRAACRAKYEQGELGKKARAVWVQVARMYASGLWHGFKRRVRGLRETCYAVWFWTLFGSGFFFNWLAALILPWERPRWSVHWAFARGVMFFTGCRFRAQGLERLSAHTPCVIVSNHQSYLDGMVMGVILPPKTSVVAKKELLNSFVTRTLLPRLGTVFVERFQHDLGAEDSRQIPKALEAGRTVLIFPEGTCMRMSGLLPFQMGGFLAAAEVGVPVVPVTIRGTRNLLRPSTWFPRRHALEVEVGAPIPPSEGKSQWATAVELRDAARAVILQASGEADLGGEDALGKLSEEKAAS